MRRQCKTQNSHSTGPSPLHCGADETFLCSITLMVYWHSIMLIENFFMLVLKVEYIFLTTFYGLYKSILRIDSRLLNVFNPKWITKNTMHVFAFKYSLHKSKWSAPLCPPSCFFHRKILAILKHGFCFIILPICCTFIPGLASFFIPNVS